MYPVAFLNVEDNLLIIPKHYYGSRSIVELICDLTDSNILLRGSIMVDKITSLEDYDFFIKSLQDEIQKLNDGTLAIVYEDIKYFKYFNDTYGYKRGDELLVRLATLSVHGRKGVVCGTRVVSDNIVWMVKFDKGTHSDIYSIIAETTAARERILREEFDCTRIRLAVGVYLIDKEKKNINPETAVSNANLARKKAKEAGSSSVAFFKEEMADNLSHELEIISSIDKAIETKEFLAYYQPKIASEGSEIMGAEALVRWKKDGKFIFPDQFIPAIERSRQIIEVDYYMYNEVFAFIRKRLDAGLKVVPISLNVSRQHMKHLEIIDYVKGLLDKYKIPTEYLEFELTETVCMEDTKNAMQFIDSFHEMGIKVSMDDFGSGFSSLNLLSEMPLDIIKLDRCFLHSNILQKKEKIVLSNIIRMAKELEITSLCEGVETEQQSDFLKEIGCDIQQGYYFARPLCEDDFSNMLGA